MSLLTIDHIRTHISSKLIQEYSRTHQFVHHRMAVSSRDNFPAKKGRQQASPLRRSSSSSSGGRLLHSLTHLARDISSSNPALSHPLQRRNSRSAVRKAGLLSLLFEELLAGGSRGSLPFSAALCLEEIFIVLQRVGALIDDLAGKSRFWLLIHTESISNSFQEAEADLYTLLDILPIDDLDVSDDAVDQVVLVKSHRRRRVEEFVDSDDLTLRTEVLSVIDDIEREVVPDRVRISDIFRRLKVNDSRACRVEMKSLEAELEGQLVMDKEASTIAALIGLVRYAKCVLFGASTPRPPRKLDAAVSTSDVAIPPDFRCPISLELMRDPVVVSTGQTYDRPSITRWIESGSKTCPKTGQPLLHTELTSNRALKNLIAKWCLAMRIPFDTVEPAVACASHTPNPLPVSKAAAEATKMTATFLVEKLREASAAGSSDTANRVVHELRSLAKGNAENRAFIADSGAVELLGPLLRSDDPSLQVNVVTALLNLSILEANKERILKIDGVFDGVVHVLHFGGTWEARENAAATVFSLTVVRAHRKVICRDPRVSNGLIEILKTGPTTSKTDALMAILNLAGEREGVGMLLEGGVVEAAIGAVADASEESTAVIAALAKHGGASAVAGMEGAVRTLIQVLMGGSDRARESVAAALVLVCRTNRKAAAELVMTPGIERVIWEIMGSGTPRARAKAGGLARICRRLTMDGYWTAGFEVQTE